MPQHHQNLKMIAFVGLTGSGKSTALDYATGKNFPKVNAQDMLSQLHHLVDAGQHRVVTDELFSFEDYRKLLEEFHHNIIIVAITTNVRTRHHRLARTKDTLNEYDMTKTDWDDSSHDAQLIALADYFIPNDGTEQDLYEALDALFVELEFAN